MAQANQIKIGETYSLEGTEVQYIVTHIRGRMLDGNNQKEPQNSYQIPVSFIDLYGNRKRKIAMLQKEL